jgi:hypothetical protein
MKLNSGPNGVRKTLRKGKKVGDNPLKWLIISSFN